MIETFWLLIAWSQRTNDHFVFSAGMNVRPGVINLIYAIVLSCTSPYSFHSLFIRAQDQERIHKQKQATVLLSWRNTFTLFFSSLALDVLSRFSSLSRFNYAWVRMAKQLHKHPEWNRKPGSFRFKLFAALFYFWSSFVFEAHSYERLFTRDVWFNQNSTHWALASSRKFQQKRKKNQTSSDQFTHAVKIKIFTLQHFSTGFSACSYVYQHQLIERKKNCLFA